MAPKPISANGEAGHAPGVVSTNESTPMDQRVPDRKTTLDEGPQTGAKGEYLPRRYETHGRTQTLVNGVQITTPPNIREDR